MPSLHDLPDELLLEIIHLLTPPPSSTTPAFTLPSLLSLALSSRRLHDLCQPALSRPQALHRKWARVCASLNWSGGTTVLLLLLDVLLLRDPGVAWYVRELDTRCGEAGAWALDALALHKDGNGNGIGNGIGDGNGIRWKALLPPLRGRIRAAAARLDEAPRQEWLEALDRAGDFDSRLSVTLLLSLLPELRALVVAERAETVLPWLQKSSLASRLRKLRLNMAHAMLPSLQLPALTELVVEETRSGYDDDDMTGSEEETIIPALPIGVCPLTRLELIRSSLCPRDLSVILQMARRDGPHGGIQSFTYSHQDYVTRPGYQVFRGPSLIKSLLIYSRQSLLEVDLDVLRIHYGDHHEMDRLGHFWYGDNITALGPGLKRFERLEILKVSIEMLVEGWCIMDEESNDDDDDNDRGDADLDDAEIGNDGFDDEELGNDQKDAESGFKATVQLPLWEVLPQSLQVLHICSKGYMHATAVVTEKLVALFNKGLDTVPRLRKLLIDWQLFEPWKGLLEGFCKQRGVRFENEQPSLPQC